MGLLLDERKISHLSEYNQLINFRCKTMLQEERYKHSRNYGRNLHYNSDRHFWHNHGNGHGSAGQAWVFSLGINTRKSLFQSKDESEAGEG